MSEKSHSKPSNNSVEISKLRKEVARLQDELAKTKSLAKKHQLHKLAFMTNLSHEIRTPLNGILGFSEIIGSNSISDEDRKFYSDIIAESSGMLVSVITDVFDISKVEMGHMPIRIKAFDLNKMVREVFSGFKESAEKKGLQLFLENITDLPRMINSDEEKLQRIVSRLIDNSIKFTKSGWIKAKYDIKGNELLFTIEDTGLEIPRNLLPTFLERFNHLVISSSMNFGGTGLSLNLCNGLVEVLGGKLWIESKSKSNGSIYSFTIPL